MEQTEIASVPFGVDGPLSDQLLCAAAAFLLYRTYLLIHTSRREPSRCSLNVL